MLHLEKSLLAAIFLLPTAAAAQNGDFVQKTDHREAERIYNISLGSKNPAFIGRNMFSSLADIKLGYAHESGSFHDIDDGKVINGLNFDFYGVKKLGKLSFEGSFAYDNYNHNNKNWNSTLFISGDNPYKVGDRIESDFNNEIFHLKGGVSYDISHAWVLGLRADYKAGKSSNQNDPRPEIDGMRFNISPGATCTTGNFTFGLAAHAELYSESMDYEISNSNTYYIAYLMQGLAQPVQRYSASFDRKYSGHEFGASAQFEWKTDAAGNFLELGYLRNREKAKDNQTIGAYRGGKYVKKSVFLKDRATFGNKKLRHQVHVAAKYDKIDGTTYEQKQTSDADGNTVWELISSAVTYQNKCTEAQAGYRIDYFTGDVMPRITGEFVAGMQNRDEKEFPDEYFQKFTSAYFDLDAKYRFNIRTARLTANLGGRINTLLSNSQELEGTIFDNNYIIPKYEYASAEYFRVRAGMEAQLPVKIRGLHTWVGVYAKYSYTGYNGNFENLKDASRNTVDTGVRLIF